MLPLELSATRVVEELQRKGFVAVFAGGCVRDKLLGVKPHDFDIATNATPDEVEALFDRTIPVGKSFGVVRVLYGGHEFEVATFRKDSKGGDGRRPDSVEFSSMEEDAKRRDLTINGMFFDPVTENLHDFVDGQRDLNNKVVRFIGNPEERIEEDKLRILRVVRFAVKLGFAIDQDTLDAVCMHAHEVLTVSWERIRDEFTKIICTPDVEKAMGLMRQTGLLSAILPEFDPMWACKQSPRWHPEGTAGVHTVLVMKHTPPENVIVRWAALLHDIGKPATSKEKNDGFGGVSAHGHEFVGADMAGPILQRFKFSNADTEEIVELVRNHMMMHRLDTIKSHTARKLAGQPFFENLILLSKGDNLGSVAGQQGINEMMDAINALRAKFPVMMPKPFVTGETLIAMGFQPGKAFRITLDKAFEQQLDGVSKDVIEKRLKGWMMAQ